MMIYKLRQHFGNKCTSVYVNSKFTGFINTPLKQMKFCEAVEQSFKVPLRLSTGNLDCPGAQRSIGFESNKKKLIKEIHEHSNVSPDFISDVLNSIPSVRGITNIDLGLEEHWGNGLKPDLYILYVQPFMITDLMHKLAKSEIIPSIPPYLFLSVCGNIFANCYLNKVVSISFGCPESRKNGGIGKNEIVVGLPFKVAVDLLHFYE